MKPQPKSTLSIKLISKLPRSLRRAKHDQAAEAEVNSAIRKAWEELGQAARKPGQILPPGFRWG